MNTTLKSLGLAILLALPLCAASTAPRAKAKAPGHPINLNTATATELMQLPRVGAKAAERIVAYRKQHGAFQRPEDLMSVKGFGEKSFLKLKPYLSTGSVQASNRPASQPKSK
ncbi:MAG: helix-hairpin-helix domain-containing protein [Acidobacteria bacterium]|nr:helix-hairpin-helix domain-containing protein [Acidobacteriota bacterium]